jgi:hypothetical protein
LSTNNKRANAESGRQRTVRIANEQKGQKQTRSTKRPSRSWDKPKLGKAVSLATVVAFAVADDGEGASPIHRRGPAPPHTAAARSESSKVASETPLRVLNGG